MTVSQTVLIRVNGPDRPGLSAGLMAVLADCGASVQDIEQIVIRGQLTLGVVVEVPEGKDMLRDVLLWGWEQGIEVDFDVVPATSTPATPGVVVTVLGPNVTPSEFGAVTNAMVLASEPVRAQALYRRAAMAYDELKAGRSLEDIVRALDEGRKSRVEARVSAFLSKMTGKDVQIRLTHIGPGARRSSKLANEWFAFDAHLDAEVTVDGVTTVLERYSDQIIPDVALGKRSDIAWAVPMVVPLASEILLASNVVINVTVPAAVAAAMGLHSPEEAGLIAQRAGFVSSGIPGSNVNAEAAARVALSVMAVP